MLQQFNKIILNLKKDAIFLKKADIVFRQGDAVNGIYFVVEGLIKVTQLDQSGKVIFTRLTMPLDTVGHRSIFIQRDFLGTAEVISENAQLIFISTKEIVRLMSENFDFSRSLIIKNSKELSKAESNSFKVKDKTSFERVAEFLFFTAMKYSDIDSNGCYRFKSEIPKNVISNILFMADETVIRAMTDLKKENVIAYDGRLIVVKDLDKLKKISKS